MVLCSQKPAAHSKVASLATSIGPCWVKSYSIESPSSSRSRVSIGHRRAKANDGGRKCNPRAAGTALHHPLLVFQRPGLGRGKTCLRALAEVTFDAHRLARRVQVTVRALSKVQGQQTPSVLGIVLRRSARSMLAWTPQRSVDDDQPVPVVGSDFKK
eukprot:3787020-Rhodomonas_salina.3